MLRYLVPFHPKRHPHFFTDVLIIGGGFAGLRAALACDPACQVLLICKNGLENSNSMQAQGGIAAVWNKNDSLQEHIEDTITAGGELCDRSIVEYVVERGPDEIRKLIEYGTQFDKTPDGHLQLGKEGGHRSGRILHANGDATGKELVRALIAEVQRRPNIRIWEQTFALDLLTEASGNRCCGAIVYWKKQGEKELVWAKQTILASGGLGQLYRETTNPDVATGDGIAMALRGGVAIRDMEFVQFHPTVLYIAGSSRSLISEAVRGEGAILVDRKGYRFMPDYDSRAELAPRDIVSRCIVAQMEKTKSSNVFLDLTALDADYLYARFPGIAAVCRHFGIDIAKNRIPVRPGAHYSMGGVNVDRDGRTSLQNLWAVGEVSSTGLHGANRLASNSLLEAAVFGESAGRLASAAAKNVEDNYTVVPIENGVSASDTALPVDLFDLRNALRSVLWRSAGVVRNTEDLQNALDDTERWSGYVSAQQFDTIEGWELQNMLAVAKAILTGALNRKTSCGAHYFCTEAD
ncbi:L-aspartate oxidase [Planctomycetales bacterium]|nr:L-aspartate oxidase [Planctomycetales bacterium]